MTKRIEFEAKSIKEAEEIAIKEFNVPLEYIKISVIKEKKGILGIGSSTLYEALLEINLAFEGKKYLENLYKALEVEVITEFRTSDEGREIAYNIQSDENALIIGFEGRTLNATQTLLRNYLNKLSDGPVRVSLDIAGYKDNRKRQLEILATKVAKEVAFSGVEARLDPMNSYERRIIHTKLAEWRDVYTESEGTGEERAIIVKPKKK
ncbi:MAG: KH domain-containing protein [Acholeplasmataceae bacterium]|jgi:spoIIIJ-associated protein|nr:KH domain-containing protein [Acholeplasmataceae bacterium]MDD4824402.1 KH domain-containing protein [Acholeplasmataceae bacterium]